jgi:hypothetical protein
VDFCSLGKILDPEIALGFMSKGFPVGHHWMSIAGTPDGNQLPERPGTQWGPNGGGSAEFGQKQNLNSQYRRRTHKKRKQNIHSRR